MSLSSYRNPYVVADAEPSTRAKFMRRTYAHLAGAIAGFVSLEAILLNSPLAPLMMNTLGKSWLIVLGAFMLVSWIADRWARSDASVGKQYAGLALYTVAEAVIFVPILYIAQAYASPTVIPMAAMITALLFAGLTAVVFTTRADFSFLRGALIVSSFIALGVIVCSLLFGFNLGLLFSGLMVAFAGASILYNTSNILHHYREDQYVAASLSLFASVALLFWYVIQIVLSFTGRD